EKDALMNIVDNGPFLSQSALDNRLVDNLSYRDEVITLLRNRTRSRAKLFNLATYFEGAGSPNDFGEKIGLIYGTGTIMPGKSGYDPVYIGEIMGAHTIAGAFRTAIKNEVKAIIFRIDSPGGSHIASDIIRREVENAVNSGIPVIASIGDVGASGGYYVAVNASKIIARPGTLTGSIGVYAIKPVLKDFWPKLGISWDSYSTNSNSDAFSLLKEFSPQQRIKFQEGLDSIYEDFTTKVASGRNLDINDVLPNAGGRVWTGSQALEKGLVDEIGGFPEALALARDEAGLRDSAPVKLIVYPKEKTLVELFLNFDFLSRYDTGNSLFMQTIDKLQPLISTAGKLGIMPDRGILRMPDIDTKR
ncbi:MAG: S49 family peptidase, partial [bacterium]|nr:S49 family peptidase [bacterium]